MASNLTGQVRNIAEVSTAVARGDLSRKITVDVKGEILELKNTVNIMARIEAIVQKGASDNGTFQLEVRARRPDGQTRWCICAAAMTSDGDGRVTGVTGVTIDITDLKEAEARRELLTREVDHRARNMLAVVQSIVHMSLGSGSRGPLPAATAPEPA